MNQSIPTPILHQRHEEFVSLLTASHDKLLGYLMSLLGRLHDAQDVLQSASILMWRKFESYESGSNFVAWASTICYYEARNYQRTLLRTPLKFDDELLATLAAERLTDLEMQSHRLSALEQCLKTVGPSGTELLRAAYAHHGGVIDLAAKLQRTPRTLYNKLTILKKRLVDCVQRRLREDLA